MNPNRIATDEAFLDEALDRALQRIEEGQSITADDLIGGQEHLRSEIEGIVRLARQIALATHAEAANIPGYSILGPLGRGGMGTVLLARQERVGGRVVALKILPAGASISPSARDRFRAEAAALSRVRHPHVVPIYDVVDEPGLLAYSMECVDGRSLGEVIHWSCSQSGEPTISELELFLRCKPGTLRDANYTVWVCRIGLQIARALAAVHEAGLLHRDVKPSNVLIRRDGTPVLTDFGLVRETDSTVHTQEGQFLGTAAYAAPEQLRGENQAIDARTDVYASGITLYHALARKLPYAARSVGQILQTLESGKTTPLRKANPKLAADLYTIVTKATEPAAKDRYASAEDLAEDLERLLNLQPIKARPSGLVSRTLKLARRNKRSLVGVMIGASLALSVSVAAAFYFLVVPHWVKGRLEQARLTLLHPEQGNAMFDAEFYGVEANVVLSSIRPEGLRTALAHYNAALRWAPFDEEIRREREVVETATKRRSDGATKGSPGGATVNSRGREPPETDIQYPQAPAGRQDPTSDGPREPTAAPPGLVPHDGTETGGLRPWLFTSAPAGLPHVNLRDQGLLAFLTGDAATAIDAWTKLDLQQEPDAFVHAALGQLYIARGEYARAYPRLRQAIDSFPNVSFLTMYLADAAVQCGDLDKAQQWLDLARTQPMQDLKLGCDRVQADLFAAQGRDEEAGAIYAAIELRNPVAQFHYARLLESRGRLEEAVEKYARVVQSLPHGRRPRDAFFAAMEKWWQAMGDVERFATVRSALEGRSQGSESFLALLVAYSAAKDRSLTVSAPIPSSPRRSVASSLFSFFATLSPPNPAPYLQRIRLSDLCQRMEVSNMTRWNCLSKLPSQVKDALTEHWLSTRTTVKGTMAEWISRRWCVATERRSDGATKGAIRAPSASAGSLRSDALTRRSRSGLGLDAAQTCRESFLFRVLVPPSLRRCVASSLLMASYAAACPPTGFTGLGDLPGGATESFAHVLSKDGTTVVGQSTSAGGTEAFRWTAATNMVGLGDAPGGAFGSAAHGVSADGNIITGWTFSANGNCLDLREGFRWTAGGGMTLLGDLPGGCFNSVGTALSDDGSVSAGIGADALAEYRASYWTAGTGWVGVGPAANASSFSCMSADGTVMGGAHHDGNNGNLIRWTSATGLVYLGDLPGGLAESSGYGMSDDGSIIVGYGHSAAGREGIRWTQATGIVGLGDLPGGAFDSLAWGTTPDGSIIVGHGTSAIGQEAVLWDETQTIHRVVDVLADNGVHVPCDWLLTRAAGVTENCGVVTIVGHAINADGDPEAWIASYRPSAPLVGFFGLGDLPGNIYASGGAAVSADGTTVVGTSFSVNCTSTYTGEPFRWRAETGMVGLGDLPGADFMGIGYGVSADGSVVTGWSSSGNGQGFGNTEAYRWTEASGMVGLGDLAGGLFKSEGDGISNDGNTIVGNAMDSSGNRAAFWTTGGGWVPVGPANIQFLGMSRTGPWACGYDASGAFRWSQGTGYESIGDLPGGATVAFGQRISDSGTVVGYGTSASGSEAFVWNPVDGMVGLGDLPGGGFGSYANGILADGTIIVGNGTSANGEEAVLWDETLAMHLVVDVLTDSGVSIPCGWTLNSVNDITENCGIITLVGRGTNSNGDTEGFLASYIHTPDADTDADLVTDCFDNCVTDPNADQADADTDGVGNVCDNCPAVANFNQTDSDADGVGEVCDNCANVANDNQANSDGDTLGNACDNCPSVTNQNQVDADADGVGNVCDNCNLPNANQADCNTDTVGDVCNIASGTSCDANGNIIPDECECEDHDACTFDHFVVGVCELTPVAYGDIDGTGVVDVDDIICTLSAFGDRCTCPAADIAPCNGNGLIDVDDILASLDAFVGNDPCNCGG